MDAEWQDEPSSPETDHSNGNWYDNQHGKLRFRCPDRRSQAPRCCTKNHRNHVNKAAQPIPETGSGEHP